MSPAGVPVSVIVWAPPPAGPNAPGSRCWQSGHVPLPSVQAVGEPVPAKHCLGACGSQVPVPTPVQQGKGTPAPVHTPKQVPVCGPAQQSAGAPGPVHTALPLLCGQAGFGSPSKQPVKVELTSRQ